MNRTKSIRHLEDQDLPDGWLQSRLRDMGQIITGNTPPKNNPRNYGRQYPWVKPSDLGRNSPITRTSEYLSAEGAAHARLLPAGTTLVSCIGILGKVGFAGTALATNQQINSVIFDESKVLPKYGFYYCRTLKDWLEENSSSTTVAIVNKSRFMDAPFLLPPINEQRRIVVKLEELLSKVDACQGRLAKIPVILKRFRQSVLAAACSGRLTSDWREGNSDVETAQEALQEHSRRTANRDRNIRRLKPAAGLTLLDHSEDLPASWTWLKVRELVGLGAIIDVQDGNHGELYPRANASELWVSRISVRRT